MAERNHNDHKQQKQRNQNQYWDKIEPIHVPLSEYYSDKAKLYLPEGIADTKAKEWSKTVTTHQLRKILGQAKLAVLEVETHPDQRDAGRNILFAILPLAAYNAGRYKELKGLFEFLKANISEETLKTQADIYTFDDLMTSIVAYHKLVAVK